AAGKTDGSITFEGRLQFKRTDEADFRVILTMPLIPNADGTATINWQTVLDAEMEFGLPQLLVDDQVTAVKAQTGIFFMEYRELTPTDSNPSWITHEANFQRNSFKGGVPEFAC